MATAWLYKYVLLSDLNRYLEQGWRTVGPGPGLGGWTSVLMRRRA